MSSRRFFSRMTCLGLLRDSTTDWGRRLAFQLRLVAGGVCRRQRYSRRSWTLSFSAVYSCSSSSTIVMSQSSTGNGSACNSSPLRNYRTQIGEPVAVAGVERGYVGEGIGRDRARCGLCAGRWRRCVRRDRSTAVTPVLVSRSIQRRFSTARMRACFRCWA